MSVRAAASFAQSGTTNSALSTTRQHGGGSKVGLFVLAVVALLAFGGIGASREMLIAHHRGAMRFEWQTSSGWRRILAPIAALVLGLRLCVVLVIRPTT